MTDTIKLTTKELLKKNLSRSVPEQMKQLKVVLHNVRSMHNVGSVFRSADAFGISDILISGFTPFPPRPEISKTAIGAEKFVPWKKTEGDINVVLEELRQRDYCLVGVEQTHQSTPLPSFIPPAKQKICLIFGNEVTGIDKNLLTEVDRCIEIPQYGKKHSLNISVAVGITLYGFLVKFLEQG